MANSPVSCSRIDSLAALGRSRPASLPLRRPAIFSKAPSAGRTGFEPSIPSNRIPASGNYARGIAALDELKQRLLREKTEAASDPVISSCLRQAAEEAVSMAWTTPYPLLVLPELFDEKAAEASLRWQRQSDIRQRSQRLVALATGEACGQERQRQRMKIGDPNRRRLFTPLSQFSFATPPIGVQDF